MPLLGRDSSLIFMLALGGRGRCIGSTGGGDSGVLIVGSPVASILVRGNANGTTPRPVTDAGRGSRSWPISPSPTTSKGDRGSGLPLVTADPLSRGTAHFAYGRVPYSCTCFFRGRHPPSFGSMDMTMLSMEFPKALGACHGRRGRGSSNGRRAPSSDGDEEGGDNP